MDTTIFTSLSYLELQELISDAIKQELKRYDDAKKTSIFEGQINDKERLINKRQAAILLGCSTGTIDNYARSGKLERSYIGVGNRIVRFKRDQVLEIVKRGKK